MRKPRVVAAAVSVLAFGPGSFVRAQDCDSDGVCDSDEKCPLMKEQGKCLLQMEEMMQRCPVSCRNANIPPHGDCEDWHPRCALWASLMECEDNPEQMHEFCKRSCGLCGDRYAGEEEDDNCRDEDDNCYFWAKSGECTNNPNYMQASCARSCGMCANARPAPATMSMTPAEFDALMSQTERFGERQKAEGDDAARVVEILKTVVEYMSGEVVISLPEDVLAKCRNNYELCAFWAVVGECENNRNFMVGNCGPSCLACEELASAQWS